MKTEHTVEVTRNKGVADTRNSSDTTPERVKRIENAHNFRNVTNDTYSKWRPRLW